MDARSEEDKAAGIIPCQIGATVKYMPTLKRKAAREWKATLGRKISGNLAEFDVKGNGNLDTLGSVMDLALLASDVIDDIVESYDVTGALGGRDYLDTNADDRQMYVILRQIIDVHFPFAKDVLGAMGYLTPLLSAAAPVAEGKDAASPPASSPSSPSPSGASTLTPSTIG